MRRDTHYKFWKLGKLLLGYRFKPGISFENEVEKFNLNNSQKYFYEEKSYDNFQRNAAKASRMILKSLEIFKT